MAAMLLSADAFADVPATQKGEVEHLLQYVELSDCVIDRNGTQHPGKEAVAHIQKKYDYFRDQIQSTDDFVEYPATRSTLSGKLYRVSCDDKAMTTKEWLFEELRVYRARRRAR